MKKGQAKYNFLENAYILCGSFIGAVTPIIGARYIIFNNESGDLSCELSAWGKAILLNMGSVVFAPHASVSVYGFFGGRIFGKIMANISQRKRFNEKKSLEKLSN